LGKPDRGFLMTARSRLGTQRQAGTSLRSVYNLVTLQRSNFNVVVRGP
jgi:hypothetical protein